MRLTALLCRQHIDFMFKRHWLIQGKRVPIETGVEEHLKSLGVEVHDANEFVEEKEEYQRIEIVDMYERAPARDETHPDYRARPCYTLRNSNVLLEGRAQAQVLTKTVISEGSLPERVEKLCSVEIPEPVHECVRKSIMSANVFDCEQKKLPKVYDPDRPAYNFRRTLGITDVRRNLILTNRILQLIERSSDLDATTSKYVSDNVNCSVIFEKESDLIQFQELSNILVTSQQPLKYEEEKRDRLLDIPDLFPVKHTITMPKEHFYEPVSSYPISPSVSKQHPHTTILHFNRTQVQNEYEAPVTHAQELGRGLVHAFTVAAAYARGRYGEDVKDLPEPVHLNCVQTDGQRFHLGVLELRTLDLDGAGGTKNLWHTRTDLELYGKCQYLGAIPTLEGYNPKVFGYINALFNS